jgi:hypothetical protein
VKGEQQRISNCDLYLNTQNEKKIKENKAREEKTKHEGRYKTQGS